jgi:hypothetical protein
MTLLLLAARWWRDADKINGFSPLQKKKTLEVVLRWRLLLFSVDGGGACVWDGAGAVVES